MPSVRKAALALLLSASAATAVAQHITLPNGIVTGADTAVPAPVKPVSLDVSAIDKTADPCNDFYAYACGNWTKSHPIPADKPAYGSFTQLSDYNRYSLYQLLEQAANHPTTPLQTKYGNYYAACMNEPLEDKLGTEPIKPTLAQVDALSDKAKLATLVGQLEAQRGYGFFYGFGAEEDQKNSTVRIATLNQGGLSLPDRDYYLQDDERSKTIRAKYHDIVMQMFTLLGDTPDKAKTEADAVLRVETALAKGSMDRTAMRDPDNVYHVETVSQLESSSPDYHWADFFAALHTPDFQKLNVAQPEFFTAMNQVIADTSIPDLKSYLTLHVVEAQAPRLSKPFRDLAFSLQQTLMGTPKQQDLWKRCTIATDSALGEAVGQEWVNKYFPASSKAQMNDLIHALEVALGNDIDHLEWMTPSTRVEARKKLAAFRQKIGYPETWRDYSTLTISRDDAVGNAERNSVFEDRRDLNKIGKPVDEKEWGMTPPTVNAYYNPAQNDINFPAGILQPPFFDPSLDKAVNFGSIGVVIGHEMTHGFDDEGAKYDETGNVRDWWTKEDKAAFDQRTQCEVNEYGNFEPAPGAKLNGKLTLGENTADNGGLRISYAALHSEIDGTPAATKKIDGFTPDQRFFLGYAQVWCENRREAFSRMMVKVDPHSPGKFRTDGAVQNFDAFGKAFQCKQGSPMYPTNSCRVW
ncbi:M13 family metallopeptidase [Terriglobus sp.]|uniref:M13 family metallopeptidase n=1 Tax=Terriglobus sp. TaxID=1889013 RepID=UPI003B0099FA